MTRSDPDVFITFHDGHPILFDLSTQERYQLDHEHYLRVAELAGGAPFGDSPVDRAIKDSGIFEQRETTAKWGWDAPARIFHLATRTLLPDGHTLPTTQHYDGYLAYCASIVDGMPALSTHRDGSRLVLEPVRDDDMPSMSLWEVLRTRKTCRAFDAEPISIQCLTRILHWSFGAIHGGESQEMKDLNLMQAGYRRSAPSAGSLQACEVYVVSLRVDGLDPGVYHYQSEDHELVRLDQSINAKRLGGLLAGQMFAEDLSFGVFITCRFEKLWWKYPRSRAYRVALIDAGALLQSFLLSSTALGLHTWPTAQFYDEEINRHLDIDGVNESVLLFAGAGHGNGSAFCAGALHAIERAAKARVIADGGGEADV